MMKFSAIHLCWLEIMSGIIPVPNSYYLLHLITSFVFARLSYYNREEEIEEIVEVSICVGIELYSKKLTTIGMLSFYEKELKIQYVKFTKGILVKPVEIGVLSVPVEQIREMMIEEEHRWRLVFGVGRRLIMQVLPETVNKIIGPPQSCRRKITLQLLELEGESIGGETLTIRVNEDQAHMAESLVKAVQTAIAESSQYRR